MARATTTPFPRVARLLTDLGARVRLARLRRRLSAALLAERAGMTRPTLHAIERGHPGVTIGAIANVLHSLRLEGDLALLARDDELGRRLQDAALETPARAPRRARVRLRRVGASGAASGRRPRG